jgi:hypothetical protein
MSLIKDIFAITRPLWFILVFQLHIAIVLLGTNEGQDMLTLMMEDMFYNQWSSLIWFLVALFFWSVVSEFGCRFILYLSDVSSHHLNPVRVARRKKIVEVYARAMLGGPIIISAAAFVLSVAAGAETIVVVSFLLALLCLGILALLIYHIYFGIWKVTFAMKAVSPEAAERLTKLTGILQETYEYIPALQTVQLSKNQRREGDYVITKFSTADFKPLFNRFKLLCVTAIVLIAVMLSIPDKYYVSIGAIAIIPLAFACWLTIYYTLEYLDKVQPFLIRLPFKLVVLLSLVTVSWLNTDHPIRTIEPKTNKKLPVQLSLENHFDQWLTDSTRHRINSNRIDKIDTTKPYPVVFVAAEGGALRTGLFTALALAKIDSLYQGAIGSRIYALSGVSGGSLGVNYFSAIKKAKQNTDSIKPINQTKIFFSNDFLSASTGRLMFGEILNYFIPWQVGSFDRATALEKSWEQAFESATNKKYLNEPLESSYAMFINTTEVESGKRCVYSNVIIDPNIFPTTKDLVQTTNHPMRHSTAIGLSARFPIVSPAATIINECDTYHYVDGGYYENQGATTLVEVIKHLQKKYKNMVPYVLVFSFGDPTVISGSTRFADELTSVIAGIYNVRGGHTDYATENLRQITGNLKLLEMAPGKSIPMNWVFSKQKIKTINSEVNTLLKTKRQFFYSLNSEIISSISHGGQKK